jgi:hypothetical protein
MNYCYSAYGLTTTFPVFCPALPPATGAVELTCAFGRVPNGLEEARAAGVGWEATPQRFLFRDGGGAGQFLVEGGTRITLELGAADHAERLNYLLSHVALPAALRQRGWVVLHAAAAGDAVGAIAVAGPSAVGKSTTLAGLIERGWAMLADDIAAVRLSAVGVPEIVPSIPELHLSEAVARQFDWDVGNATRQPGPRRKLTLETGHAMARGPLPLRAIYFLQPNGSDKVRATPLHGGDRFAALHQAVAGPWFPENQASAFPIVSAILASVPVIQLERPRQRWSLTEILEVILNGQ